MEESSIKKEIKSTKSYIIFSDNNNIFYLTIQNQFSIINILSYYYQDNIIKYNYEKDLKLEELKENQYFYFFDNIDEIYNELINLLDKNKSKIIEGKNEIDLNIPTDNLKIKEIKLCMKKINKFSLILQLQKEMNKLKEDNRNLREEINNIKKDNSNLREDINKLQDDNRDLRDKIYNIKEEINQKDKEINNIIKDNKDLTEQINNVGVEIKQKDEEIKKKMNNYINEKISNLYKEFEKHMNQKLEEKNTNLNEKIKLIEDRIKKLNEKIDIDL